ncbi:hypothetical protein HK099_005428 [Clydaea vesicula]|uniref:Rad60/SUMO-like domain-containing protein n=1 Tax=Clydaea vesicula TaxID=447962 RepID=A0AAD5U0D1_9FUNG|nr:hypothetical protein HK099_005428 [Clydaea vesicula]
MNFAVEISDSDEEVKEIADEMTELDQKPVAAKLPPGPSKPPSKLRYKTSPKKKLDLLTESDEESTLTEVNSQQSSTTTDESLGNSLQSICENIPVCDDIIMSAPRTSYINDDDSLNGNKTSLKEVSDLTIVDSIVSVREKQSISKSVSPMRSPTPPPATAKINNPSVKNPSHNLKKTAQLVNKIAADLLADLNKNNIENILDPVLQEVLLQKKKDFNENCFSSDSKTKPLTLSIKYSEERKQDGTPRSVNLKDGDVIYCFSVEEKEKWDLKPLTETNNDIDWNEEDSIAKNTDNNLLTLKIRCKNFDPIKLYVNLTSKISAVTATFIKILMEKNPTSFVKKQLTIGSCLLLFDNEILDSNSTLEETDLESDDVIDAKITIIEEISSQQKSVTSQQTLITSQPTMKSSQQTMRSSQQKLDKPPLEFKLCLKSALKSMKIKVNEITPIVIIYKAFHTKFDLKGHENLIFEYKKKILEIDKHVKDYGFNCNEVNIIQVNIS